MQDKEKTLWLSTAHSHTKWGNMKGICILTELLESHDRSLSPMVSTELSFGGYMEVKGYVDIPSTEAMGRGGGAVNGKRGSIGHGTNVHDHLIPGDRQAGHFDSFTGIVHT
jgi:hypothetical protein